MCLYFLCDLRNITSVVLKASRDAAMNAHSVSVQLSGVN
jgi:hypothetical protein